MDKYQEAIAYFEDAVRESDEIIAECSPALQSELTEQKQHFVVALETLRVEAERMVNGYDTCYACTPCEYQSLKPPQPLTLEQLRERNFRPVWVQRTEKKYSGWAIWHGNCAKQVAHCGSDLHIACFVNDYGKTWQAYDRPPEVQHASGTKDIDTIGEVGE